MERTAFDWFSVVVNAVVALIAIYVQSPQQRATRRLRRADLDRSTGGALHQTADDQPDVEGTARA